MYEEKRENMNKVILIGRLTKNPEIRTTQQNLVIARYTLAVTRKFKQSQEDADFINCVTFGKMAQFANTYLDKGMKIAIVGRLQVHTYDDQNGQKRWTTEVVAEEQYFACDKKKQTIEGEQNTGFYPVEEDENLPF